MLTPEDIEEEENSIERERAIVREFADSNLVEDSEAYLHISHNERISRILSEMRNNLDLELIDERIIYEIVDEAVRQFERNNRIY